MKIFKKKITEEEAVSAFIRIVGKNAHHVRNTACTNLKDIFKDKFTIENKSEVILDFLWAMFALENQVLKNLFPKEQAESIHQLELFCLSDDPEFGNFAVEEVRKYEEAFQQNLERGKMPTNAISARLLQRWLGKNIRNFEVQSKGINGKKIKTIDPLLIEVMDSIFVSYIGTWKALKREYKIR